jgi:hypothetical protein
VISGMQKRECRELTDVELDAVSGGGYVYNPAQATFMNPDYQTAIAVSHELSAIYIANH